MEKEVEWQLCFGGQVAVYRQKGNAVIGGQWEQALLPQLDLPGCLGTGDCRICIVLHCIALYCIALHVLYCIALHVLYCIVLCCVVLYCIVLYCVVLQCA